MENPEIIKLRIRSGWLNNPDQIKEDLQYMNIRRRELSNFKITRVEIESVTSGQLKYTRTPKPHQQPLTEAELKRNEKYLDILSRITHAVNHITRRRYLNALADEMSERFTGHSDLRKSRLIGDLRQSVRYKEK
jgi:hypothetical protein